MTEKESEKDKPLPEDTPKPPPETPNPVPLKNWVDRLTEELVKGLNKGAMEEDGERAKTNPTPDKPGTEE